MTRAFSYIRFSQEKQKKGESFRRQSEFAVELCKERNWVLDDQLTLHDLGVSAFRGKNAQIGALSEFLEAVKIGRVPANSVLIVESIDRLSRNKVGDALELFMSILRSNISIVTREPNRTYTKESLNDVVSLLEPIFYMSRAHEESATKSFRLKDVWSKKKEKAKSGVAMTRMAPGWLEIVDGKFKEIPGRVATVREIFRLSREGLGSLRILHYLTERPEQHPPFGASGKWRDSYIQQILTNRAVFGEFQPGVRSEDGKKKECGEPIKNYFPVIISEEEFYRVQSGLKARAAKVTSPGDSVANLFTGIVYCALSGTTMPVTTFTQPPRKGAKPIPYRYLISGLVANGEIRGKKGLSFPYDQFEAAILDTLRELKGSDILGVAEVKADLQSEIDMIQAKLDTVEKRIVESEERVSNGDDVDVHISLLRTLHKNKQTFTNKIEELRGRLAEEQATSLSEIQSILDVLLATSPQDIKPVRQRLKTKLRGLISEIWVHITRINHLRKVAQAQIFFKNGTKKHIRIYQAFVQQDELLVEDFSKVDLRRLGGR